MSEDWWYQRGDQKYGPVSSAELQALRLTGFINGENEVWRNGYVDWVPLAIAHVDTSEVIDEVAFNRDRFTRQAGVGRSVLNFLRDSLGIDSEWMIEEPMGFTWWPYRLTQRIWAEPLPSQELSMVCVIAETPILTKVKNLEKAGAVVNALNKFASLNTYVWNQETGRLSVRCSALMTEENVGWLRSFLFGAVGIQVADAHVKADQELASLLWTDTEPSFHPTQGPRKMAAEILSIVESVFVPDGCKESPFTRADFSELQLMTPSPSTMTNSSETGATAEFPFYGQEPALLRWLKRRSGVTSALLQIESRIRHPQLGSGALLKLTLPLNISEERGREIALELNLAETKERTWCHGFGAWCTDHSIKESIAYVMFIPAVLYRPRILQPFFWHMAARTKWVRQYLSQRRL
ncbi:MAG: DUF4339 domain-containing protein [Nitrospira sp.]|nr:DUF4339 domain-containing protein [Nitrospira sp.]